MEIIIDKPVKKIVYKNHRLEREEILEDGIIFSQQNLISPMRDRFNIGLTDKEPHIGFKNSDGPIYIPVKDIITLEYYDDPA